MSVRRALADCAVLSLQDACVFYPCCKGCFSRIDADERDGTRCRCYRCGYRCAREQVDYRYRLSLKVCRDRYLFRVTVFGACLNPFFGIDAGGLQRLVEDLDGPVGPSTKTALLRNAVTDCFIGRRFIFGLKLTGTESLPWSGGPAANGSSSKETLHFIASQMFLPKATGLSGCTVVSYYRMLLQRAAESEQDSTDPGKTSGPRAITLLLTARPSPTSSFHNGTLYAPGLLSQSLQSLSPQNSTITPTPPWQQSLGLITSSAEQEEGCSSQASGDDIRRQRDYTESVSPENNKVTDVATVLSPLLPLECSPYDGPSFSQYPYTPDERADGVTPIVNTWFSPSPPGYNSAKARDLSTRQSPDTFLPSSLAWEDLPFSESLTEFLCAEKQNVDIVSELETRRKVQNETQTNGNQLEVRSQDRDSSVKATPVCERNTQITDSRSQALLSITNTPVLHRTDRRELSGQLCRNLAECLNKSKARNICSDECNQEDEGASSLSSEHEEEQLEGETYNCSADLFSGSLVDTDSNTFGAHAESPAVVSMPGKPRLITERTFDPHSTPDNLKPRRNNCINRDSLIPLSAQYLDFVPPSQSTPIVKVADPVSGSLTSSYGASSFGEFRSQCRGRDSGAFYQNLPELDSSLSRYKCANHRSQQGRESTKENLVWSSRHRHRTTPKARIWKPDKHKSPPRVRRGAPNARSAGRISPKCDSSDCAVTVFDDEDSEGAVVPPTPAARPSGNLRGRRPTDDSSSDSGHRWEGQQGGGVPCKRTLLDRALASSPRGVVQKKHCDGEAADEESRGGPSCYRPDDENEACDWSRDLFSDSV